MQAIKGKQRWWQFGLREALIVIGGVAAELAIIRAIPILLGHELPLQHVLVELAVCISVFFLLGLPIGVTAGLISRRWKVAVVGTAVAVAIWFGALRLFVTIDEGIRDLQRPTIVAPPSAP